MYVNLCFGALYSVSLVYISVFLPVPQCFHYCQFSCSLCLTLCDPMDCIMLGLPVHHQLLEFTQTCVRLVGDAIQLSHPLSPPSPPAPNPSLHQGLFQVAKVLKLQLQQSVLPMNIQSWVDWFELLAVQGTLKSLLHNSKA